MSLTLVLGGARSGKSRFAQTRAEQRADATGGNLTFIATAKALDDEMRDRIERHRADRDGRWRTLDAPRSLAAALATLRADDVAVVDCLTLWLTNVMIANAPLGPMIDELVAAASDSVADLILVSNEVGLGIVPDNPLARRFRDEAGRLHQRLAERALGVILVVAGLPLFLKGT